MGSSSTKASSPSVEILRLSLAHDTTKLRLKLEPIFADGANSDHHVNKSSTNTVTNMMMYDLRKKISKTAYRYHGREKGTACIHLQVCSKIGMQMDY